MKNKAIFKFNNGNLALLCNECKTIIKVGKEFTQEERNACKGGKQIPLQYCEECKKLK